jgi:hypothetical protein
LAAISVNHRAPSGPLTIPSGPLSGVGASNDLSSPQVVIRAIRFLCDSVNHSAPSEPVVIPYARRLRPPPNIPRLLPT